MARAAARCRSAIAANDTDCGASLIAWIAPVSCTGKKPLGTMTYNATVGFTNVLYGVHVPRRDGKPLGATQFANMHAAYDDLDPALKTRLANMTATHDFNKFWEEMRRRPGSTRPPLTPEQRAKRPPSVHPIFLTHPITGRTVLYCNPGYAIRINELPEAESERMLAMLF